MVGRHLRRSVVYALCVLTPTLAAAQQPPKASPDSAALALARRLLQAMHYSENIVAGVETALAEQRRQNTQLPAVFYDSLVARMKRTAPELLDSLVPGYARRFTRAELEGMVRFFESPAGQTLATQQASLSLEAMQFGQRWGARLAAAIMKDLVDAGIDITKP
jgi:hypothetical protein